MREDGVRVSARTYIRTNARTRNLQCNIQNGVVIKRFDIEKRPIHIHIYNQVRIVSLFYRQMLYTYKNKKEPKKNNAKWVQHLFQL